jgi:hypothetical protein
VDQTGLQGVSPENVCLMCLIAEGPLCSCEPMARSKQSKMKEPWQCTGLINGRSLGCSIS